MSSYLSRLCLLFLCSSTILSTAKADQSDNTATTVIPEITESQTLTTPKVKNLRPVELEHDNKLVKPAFLNKRLPEAAIAYARIPNIWAALGTPSGNSLDPAVGSKEFYSAATSIKEGFTTTVLPELPEELHLLLRILTQHMDSPLEAALLKAPVSEMAPANVLLAASMSFEKQDILQDLLREISNAKNEIKLTNLLDSDGFATLELDGLGIQLFWDKEDNQLWVYGGLNSTLDQFKKLLKDIRNNDKHTMHATEKEIDASGKGAFIWINPPEMILVAEKTGVPRDELAPFSAIGVKAMKNAAFGVGTSGQISHLKFVVDMPMMGLRALIPSIGSSPTFNLSDETSIMATLGIPNKSQIKAYETMASMASPESMVNYHKFKEGFAEVAGFNLEDIFSFFGQDISVVSGESGTFFALRLNDKEAFRKMLEKSVKDYELAYEQREIAGHTYHHLQLPNLSLDQALKDHLTDGTDQIAKRMLSVPTHFYWEQEGDYLIMANLPQTLMDRHNIPSAIPANEWLKGRQHMEAEGALLMVSAVSKGVASSVYRMQLSMLSYFGDITDRPVDLFKLPTPREAELPLDGTYGLKLTSTDSQLAIELAFEDNPLEFLGGNTYASAAVASLATILGITAQEEYERRRDRAKLAPGIAAAKQMSGTLDKYKAEHGKYPDRVAIDTLDLELEANTYTLSIEENSGKITITYTIDEYLGGDDLLTFTPPSEDSSEWKCASDIYFSYLPDSCI